MCRPSRLILEGRSCCRHDARAGLAVDAAASARDGAGRAGSPCEPESRVQTSGAVLFVAPTFSRPCRQCRETLWRQRMRVRQNRVVLAVVASVKPDRRCARARPGGRHHPIRTAREARTNSAPGRARHKPSDHRAGKAVCWASPVCCCAVLPARAFRAADRGCEPAPGLPCALLTFRGRSDEAKLGRIQPRGCEGVSAHAGEFRCGHILRHCERSEAIQKLSAEGFWIASSQGLLAMTRRGERALNDRA